MSRNNIANIIAKQTNILINMRNRGRDSEALFQITYVMYAINTNSIN